MRDGDPDADHAEKMERLRLRWRAVETDLLELTELLRQLNAVAELLDDDPRRQAWLARKRQLVERIGGEQ